MAAEQQTTTHPYHLWCRASRLLLTSWWSEWMWFPLFPAATLRNRSEMMHTTQKSPPSDPHPGTCRLLNTPGSVCCLEAERYSHKSHREEEVSRFPNGINSLNMTEYLDGHLHLCLVCIGPAHFLHRQCHHKEEHKHTPLPHPCLNTASSAGGPWCCYLHREPTGNKEHF